MFWIFGCGLRCGAAHLEVIAQILRVFSDSRLFGHESEGECEGILPIASLLLCLRAAVVYVVGDVCMAVCIETEWPTRGHFGSRLELSALRS